MITFLWARVILRLGLWIGLGLYLTLHPVFVHLNIKYEGTGLMTKTCPSFFSFLTRSSTEPVCSPAHSFNLCSIKSRYS